MWDTSSDCSGRGEDRLTHLDRSAASRSTVLEVSSDEWDHQACQLPPEVSRLPPPGSQATEPGGGSGAERRGPGPGRRARAHSASLESKNEWKYGETRGGPEKRRGAGCTSKQGAGLGASNAVGRSACLVVTTGRFCKVQYDNDGVTFQISMMNLPIPVLPCYSRDVPTQTNSKAKFTGQEKTLDFTLSHSDIHQEDEQQPRHGQHLGRGPRASSSRSPGVRAVPHDEESSPSL
ncbi:hypothetical protein EYF80_008566 [Liparis tanakae]|uniref:Uncharacterized protein n=1 Tax=Liparis tanakae TaxID=230148 RepID=A0A4Z2IVC9_9TELE|nr:hypothetical protein EYF80_008566 [Liparis tanakae]